MDDDLDYHKKAQLMQGLCATTVHVWRPLGNKSMSSAGNPTLEPNITSIGERSGCKVMAILYIHDGRQPPSWIFGIQKLHH